jgi:uncharacterized protein (TIGR03435 family)
MKKALLLAIVAFAATVHAQTFDVASVKPTRSEDGPSSIRPTNGLITVENASLRKIILGAYNIPDDRDYVLIGPPWLGTEHFDIQARFPADTAIPQVRQMMQALLAERFKLELHHETRQLPSYALVVEKSGLKIHSVEIGQPRTVSGPGRLQATKIPMQKLADLLARIMGQPVTDATGLSGVFDFTLEWSPLASAQSEAGGRDAADGASIFTALQEQLGLKLESRKGPVDVLVVDRIEKIPTKN